MICLEPNKRLSSGGKGRAHTSDILKGHLLFRELNSLLESTSHTVLIIDFKGRVHIMCCEREDGRGGGVNPIQIIKDRKES